MKRIKILAHILLMTLLSHAEYGGWYIKFQLETNSGETIIGHTYVAQAYFDMDSTSSTEYLIDRFDVLDHHTRDTIIFYHNFLTYTYSLPGSDDQYQEYTMLDRDSIPNTEVKSISILDTIYHWYLSDISSVHEMSDTQWMKKPADEIIMVDGYYCSWEVFVYDDKELAEEIRLKLEFIQASYSAQFAIINATENMSEFERSQAYEKIEVDIEHKYSKYLHSIKNKKIVIITFCSC